MSRKSDPNKPVLFANYTPDEDIAAPDGGALEDASWIPGYSQVLQANEIASASDFVWNTQHEKTGITKQQMYEVIGARPQPLPVTFKWLRVTGPDGGNSYTADADRMKHTERGYRIVTPEMLQNWGLGLPPAAHVAGGMIRRMDTALFVVDGRRERAYEARLAQETAEREGQPERQGDSGVVIRSETERDTFTLTTKE